MRRAFGYTALGAVLAFAAVALLPTVNDWAIDHSRLVKRFDTWIQSRGAYYSPQREHSSPG